MSRPTPDELRATPYFLGCTTSELVQLTALVEQVRVPPGVVLAERGGVAGDVHLVLWGTAVSAPPREWWGAGDFIGELAVLRRGRQPYTVVAESAMTLLCAREADAGRFLAHPVVALHLSRTLGRRARAT